MHISSFFLFFFSIVVHIYYGAFLSSFSFLFLCLSSSFLYILGHDCFGYFTPDRLLCIYNFVPLCRSSEHDPGLYVAPPYGIDSRYTCPSGRSRRRYTGNGHRVVGWTVRVESMSREGNTTHEKRSPCWCGARRCEYLELQVSGVRTHVLDINPSMWKMCTRAV
jgi:hypothetical protein